VRLALVGHTHWELDVEGAHFAIFLDCLRRYVPHLAILPGFDSVTAARASLKDIFEPLTNGIQYTTAFAKASPDYPKKTLTIALNLPGERMLTYMEQFFPPPQAVPRRYQLFLTWVNEAKNALWHSHMPRPQDPRMRRGNQIYFMLENIEEQFLSMVTAVILEHHQVDSILWLHDGIWFSPPAPFPLIDAALAAARQALQLPTVRAKYQSLAQARTTLLRGLPLPSTLQTSNDLRLRLHNEYGRYVPPEPRTRMPLTSAHKQVTLSHQRKRKFDPLQLSVWQYLARKAKQRKLAITID
jgi:hypothetical protein